MKPIRRNTHLLLPIDLRVHAPNLSLCQLRGCRSPAEKRLVLSEGDGRYVVVYRHYFGERRSHATYERWSRLKDGQYGARSSFGVLIGEGGWYSSTTPCLECDGVMIPAWVSSPGTYICVKCENNRHIEITEHPIEGVDRDNDQ